jgi:hypothetical protein
MDQSVGRLDAEKSTAAWAKRLERPQPAPKETDRHRPLVGRRAGANLIGVLKARYPVVCRLVTEPSFRLAARCFILADPPCIPLPHSFGDDFPRFLRSRSSLACVEYIAGVAELEMLRHKAQHARHARPLAALALSSLQTEKLLALRIVLHPSVCLIQSRFPIVTAWENNQPDNDGGTIERWVGEDAMVARPFRDVEVRRLPPGGYAFLRALSEGQTVATAAQMATEAGTEFDVVASLGLIEDAKVIVAIYKN